MLDQFHPSIHDSIENIVDVKADSNCGYCAIAVLLDCSVHRVIYISHVYDNHFVQVFLRDHCPLPRVTLLWSTYCHHQAKQWPTPYISRMQQYTNLSRLKIDFVDLAED
ncbi:hypothetical protein GmHk_17G049618 [Glycine max]|nr:hypothetical protein GmHk_17G049618 [Glycine max]